jgi:hypothetical protein
MISRELHRFFIKAKESLNNPLPSDVERSPPARKKCNPTVQLSSNKNGQPVMKPTARILKWALT